MPRKFTPRTHLTQPDGSAIPPAINGGPIAPGIIIKPAGASEPMEQKIGQDNPRVLSSTGDARSSLEPARIEPVDRPVSGEKLAMMAFMNEPIRVHIHATNNKEDEQIFELFINGERQVFRRNEHKTVPRRFVDLLARLKPTTYTQREITQRDGVKAIENMPSTGLRYPFSVVEDNHPRGREWIQAVLSEA